MADQPASGWLTDLLNRASREERRSPARLRRASRRADDERTPRHSIESLEFALGRHRAHDRPRRRRRTVGPLQARRAQRVHPPALHHAGPEGVRRDPQASIAPTANSSRPSTAISASSSGCSKRSRATTAARWWRAPISPRKPARSTPCWRTRPAASTERRPKARTRLRYRTTARAVIRLALRDSAALPPNSSRLGFLSRFLNVAVDLRRSVRVRVGADDVRSAWCRPP